MDGNSVLANTTEKLRRVSARDPRSFVLALTGITDSRRRERSLIENVGKHGDVMRLQEDWPSSWIILRRFSLLFFPPSSRSSIINHSWKYSLAVWIETSRSEWNHRSFFCCSRRLFFPRQSKIVLKQLPPFHPNFTLSSFLVVNEPLIEIFCRDVSRNDSKGTIEEWLNNYSSRHDRTLFHDCSTLLSYFPNYL